MTHDGFDWPRFARGIIDGAFLVWALWVCAAYLQAFGRFGGPKR